jgi:hypothetical protein
MNFGIEVFKLEPILDNPLFEGMASANNVSFLGRESVFDDFFPVGRDTWDWSVDRLSAIWSPIRATGRTRSFNDFPCLDMMIPAFSRHAVDALRDYLEPNGELLPVIHPAGEYYAYNCFTIAEVLDHTSTEALWSPIDARLASMVDYYSLFLDRLDALTIFRMRELANHVYVTTPFVERVRALGLNGFHFVKVWPWPKGTNFRLEDKKNRWREQEIVTPDGLAGIKAQSLVICLPLESGKLSKDEKNRISAMEDELDAQLYTPTLDSPYYGSLEGKKTAKGVTTLYLSCPDSEALFRKLEAWLKALAWEPRPTVLVREVSFDDFNAGGREVVV